MKIQLLWFDGCPSYRLALDLLERTIQEEKIDATIEMVQVRDAVDAVEKKFLGSPTIRIDGIDPFAQGNETNFAMQCRVYRTPQGLRGVPTREMLSAALHPKAKC